MLEFRAADTIARQFDAGESWISAQELRDLRQSPFVNLFLINRRGRWSVAFVSKSPGVESISFGYDPDDAIHMIFCI